MNNFSLILGIAAFIVLMPSSPFYAQECIPDDYQKSAIQDLADEAAEKLMECCSTWGGNSLDANVYYSKDENGQCETRVSPFTEEIIITMKASWEGSISGTDYWIKGELTYDIETEKREWDKISDSEGFSPACSKGCID